MLSMDDRRRLRQLEDQLLREDPAFVERMSGRPRRRPLPRALLLTCCVGWGTTVVLAAASLRLGALVAAMLAVATSVAVAYVAAT